MFPTSDCQPPPGAALRDKEDLLVRLSRIEGQVRGIARMIREDRYCIDILTQVAAVCSALKTVALLVLSAHLRGCVAHRLSSEDDPDTIIDELLETLKRYLNAG